MSTEAPGGVCLRCWCPCGRQRPVKDACTLGASKQCLCPCSFQASRPCVLCRNECSNHTVGVHSRSLRPLDLSSRHMTHYSHMFGCCACDSNGCRDP
eukprot:scaffold311387_cov18-Tisochrysis_lutea.AAC.1